MKKEHPIDVQVQKTWDDLVQKIDALFDDSPYKGSNYEDEALMCLATSLIPEQFKWEAVFSVGQRLRFTLVGYCPEIEEVTNEASLRKHGFITEQTGRLN